MVKFSKQFEAQLVPEWKEAFVDYSRLKKDVKRIAHAAIADNCSIKSISDITSLNKKKPSSSFFSATISSAVRKISMLGQRHREHGPIQVHRKLTSSTSKGVGELYETELFEQFTDVEAAAEFFSHLDLQLNKVNQFYKTKEKEFLDRGESLKKQMDILVELKTVLNQHHREKVAADQSSTDHNISDDPSFSCHIRCEEDDPEKTVENGKEESTDGNDTEETEKDGMQSTESSLGKSDRGRFLNNSQGMKSLRLKIPLTIPSRTFSAISYLVRDDQLGNQSNSSTRKFSTPKGSKFHVNKAKLHQAEKMIRGAFIELYKGLSYLKTFRNLNMLAFIKILKKFDKVTNKEVMPIYLRVVESSYFNSSDKVLRLSDEVEEQFIKHFTEDDRRKAMKYLKPNHRKESHAVTFFIGIFAGCFLALLAGYVIMAHIAGMYTQRPSDRVYMETVYPVLSLFSLLFLHFFLYGCNIFMWKRSRINYSFIFELAQTKELKYREVFLICVASMTVIFGVLFIHLSLMAKGYSSIQVQAIPGFLLLFFLLLLICPFNIIYKSSRQRFLRVIRNIAFSPLYKVVMLDFFMADQLCSQVPLLRNLESVACYYITGSYKTQDYGYCMRTTHYRDLAYAVSFLPYYWRAMQCARRWFDEGQSSHLVNLGKYVSAMLAAGAKVAYDKERSIGYLFLVVALSSAATMYQLYWDYVKDWGLLQFNSKNPWLRDELMVKQKSVYYFSMVLNLILRLAWLQTVLHPNFGNIDYRVMGLFLAALEVIRRGQWNFYRLENEHLNNAGKFRAVKTVPLPFHEVDEED